MGRWRTAEFFAGSGLVTEGLLAHSEVVWANDISSSKAAIYQKNHPDEHFCIEDICSIAGGDIPEHDFSWASFPCQDLSLAGRMGGIEASRSGMFWEWLRVLDEISIKPKAVCLENVVGLVSTAGGDHYRALHRALAKRGYRAGAVMLDAQHWLPQSRRRIFVIGVQRDVDISPFEAHGPLWHHPKAVQKAAIGLDDFVWWNLPEPSGKPGALSELIEWEADCFPKGKSQKILDLIPARHRDLMHQVSKTRSIAVFPGYRRTRNGKQVLELRFDEISGCLRTAEGGSSRQLLVLWKDGRWKVRLLTPREAARLMGAPETYELSRNYNESYTAMGDAVAVPVVKFLAEYLILPLMAATKTDHVIGRKTSALCLQP